MEQGKLGQFDVLVDGRVVVRRKDYERSIELVVALKHVDAGTGEVIRRPRRSFWSGPWWMKLLAPILIVLLVAPAAIFLGLALDYIVVDDIPVIRDW